MNPPNTAAFFWTQESWGRALRVRPLAPFADHFYTTRDLRLASLDSGGQEGWDLLAAAIGVDRDCVTRVRQVHGATVIHADEGDRRGAARPDADAIVTGDSRQALSIQVADCVPLLVADPGTGLVAAAHAGWRGTAAGVAPATVRALAARGAEPANLIVAIGPSIGPCCYQVGEELVEAFERAGAAEQAGRWFSRRDGRLYLDLWAANRDQLEAAGVGAGNVHVASMCTACGVDLFYSYRRDGARAGRIAAVIRPGRGAPLRPSPR